MGPAAGTPPPLTPEQACEISLLKNIRYHEDREAHFGWINRALDLFVVLSGTATVVALSDLLPAAIRIDGRWIAAVTSVVGAVQLVLGLSRKEHVHADLRRRFLTLHGELKDTGAEATRKRMSALYPDEPPTFYAVDKLAYNAGMTALSRPESSFMYVPWSKRMLRHWRRYDGVQFRRCAVVWAERDERRAKRWWRRKR